MKNLSRVCVVKAQCECSGDGHSGYGKTKKQGSKRSGVTMATIKMAQQVQALQNHRK